MGSVRGQTRRDGTFTRHSEHACNSFTQTRNEGSRLYQPSERWKAALKLGGVSRSRPTHLGGAEHCGHVSALVRKTGSGTNRRNEKSGAAPLLVTYRHNVSTQSVRLAEHAQQEPALPETEPYAENDEAQQLALLPSLLQQLYAPFGGMAAYHAKLVRGRKRESLALHSLAV